MRLHMCFGWLLGILVLTGSVHAAIMIDGYTPNTNDRFTNNASFIAAQFDLSGIGQTAGGRWATLVSPNVVVSANHFPPSGTVNFYPTNNPNSTAVTRTIVSSVKVGSTDLWLGVLSSEVPSSIRTYNFATTFISGTPPTATGFFVTNAGPFQGANAYLVGISPSPTSGSQSQAIGRNLITGFAENVPFEGNTDNDSLILNYDPVGSASYTVFESHFVVNDSGAPMFIDQGGDLLLLGTNAFVGPNSGPVQFSGVNYIGNQASFVNNFISVNAVPEPSSISLAVFSIVAALVVTRRRSR